MPLQLLQCVAHQGIPLNLLLIVLFPWTQLYRSSILTGKYTHNHHTYENSVDTGCNGPEWRQENEKKTIGVYMSAAGYTTGYFGLSFKYFFCICHVA